MRFIKRFLINLTWPIGHFVLLKNDWVVCTVLKRRRWWSIPLYEKGFVLSYDEAIIDRKYNYRCHGNEKGGE